MPHKSECSLSYSFDLFESMNDPIFAVNNNNCYLYGNQAFIKLAQGVNSATQLSYFQHFIRDEKISQLAFIGIVHELGQSKIDLSKYVWAQPITKQKQSAALSNKELEVLRLMSIGHTGKDIARLLGNSVHTIVFHQKSIYLKLGAKSKVEAINEGRKLRLLQGELIA